MSPTRTYSLILFFAALGMALSGYLTWLNYFAEGCREFFISCGGVNPVKIFGVPTCVYGLVMFTIVAILAVAGLLGKNAGLIKPIMILGVIGTLFAASLSVYELWIRDVALASLPACVYGFFFYLGILLAAAFVRRQPATGQTPL